MSVTNEDFASCHSSWVCNKSRGLMGNQAAWILPHPTPAFSHWNVLISMKSHRIPYRSFQHRECEAVLLYKVISAARVLLSVTKLHVSDHPLPLPACPHQGQEGETSRMRSLARWTARCRNMLPLRTPDISEHLTSENICPFLESRKTALWGHGSHVCISQGMRFMKAQTHIHSIELGRYPDGYFIFLKIQRGRSSDF